jgi:hypothetical protein
MLDVQIDDVSKLMQFVDDFSKLYGKGLALDIISKIR